jgi:hypothetical protein
MKIPIAIVDDNTQNRLFLVDQINYSVVIQVKDTLFSNNLTIF